MSAPVSHTSSAAKTTAASQAAGSVTMTTTAEITLTRRAAVGPTPYPTHHFLSQALASPSSAPRPSYPRPPVQGVASQGKGVRYPSAAFHPTLCPVLELVTFHLISCFSPFSHCPLGVAEVGVSGVPLFLPAPPLPGAPPIPVRASLPTSLTGPSPRPGACLRGLVFPSFPYMACPKDRTRDLCPLPCVCT